MLNWLFGINGFGQGRGPLRKRRGRHYDGFGTMTVIICPACGTRYEIAAVIPPEGRRVRCSKCAHVWQAQAVVEAPKAAPGAPGAAPKPRAAEPRAPAPRPAAPPRPAPGVPAAKAAPPPPRPAAAPTAPPAKSPSGALFPKAPNGAPPLGNRTRRHRRQSPMRHSGPMRTSSRMFRGTAVPRRPSARGRAPRGRARISAATMPAR